MRSVTHLLRSSTLKCYKQTSAIVNFFPSSLFPSEASRGTKKNLSLLWRISLPSGDIQEHKSFGDSEIKEIRSLMKQDFSGDALSKQNTKAQLASLHTTCSGQRLSGPPYSHRMYYNSSVTYVQKVTTLISQVQLLLILFL